MRNSDDTQKKILIALSHIMKGEDKRVTEYKLSLYSGVHRSTVNRFFKNLNKE